MNTLTAKRLLARVWRLFRKKGPRRVVLLYHAVGNGPDACPAEQFEAQMAWLASHAQVGPLGAVLASDKTEALQVAITFDDGYASVAEVAAPIMERHGLVGTVYLTANCISEAVQQGSDPDKGHLDGEMFMTWPQVQALQLSGWEIGSHGMDHVDMTAQSPDALQRQLQGARGLIESKLGTACTAFAYPWGRNRQETRDAARAAGYAHAAGTLHGPLTQASPSWAFPRIDIRRSYSLPDVIAMLRGDWDYLGLLQALRMRRDVGR